VLRPELYRHNLASCAQSLISTAPLLLELANMALTFHRAEGFQNALDDVGCGMLMGHACKSLLAVKWVTQHEEPGGAELMTYSSKFSGNQEQSGRSPDLPQKDMSGVGHDGTVG
jgi:hypothetical protein